MSKDQRGWVMRLVAALVAIAVLFAALMAVNSALDPFDDRPFDQVAWAAAEDHERERGSMARFAIQHIPLGTPKERVRELLGQPDEALSGYPPDRWGRQTKGYSRWGYWLGCWSGLGPYGFDSASLDVHFDADGRVVEAEITGG